MGSQQKGNRPTGYWRDRKRGDVLEREKGKWTRSVFVLGGEMEVSPSESLTPSDSSCPCLVVVGPVGVWVRTDLTLGVDPKGLVCGIRGSTLESTERTGTTLFLFRRGK